MQLGTCISWGQRNTRKSVLLSAHCRSKRRVAYSAAVREIDGILIYVSIEASFCSCFAFLHTFSKVWMLIFTIQDTASRHAWIDVCTNPRRCIIIQSLHNVFRMYRKQTTRLFHMDLYRSSGYSDGDIEIHFLESCAMYLLTWYAGFQDYRVQRRNLTQDSVDMFPHTLG